MGTATTKIHKRVDIRRNDTVKVMTGRDAGKEGRVLRVFPEDAKLLVEHVMAECRVRGASFVSLEVRVSNAGAIALYAGLGFIETGRRKKYYENGEDAILMEYLYTNGEE